jgi:phosphoribosyl-ATP pyrophosphohydrolase/phosphoribosyl-AMP cyclohydrolase
MQEKKFIPCMYLYKGMVVKDNENLEAISMNPVEHALAYTSQDTDALIIFDLSKTDEDHEESIEIIKNITDKVEVPVLGTGNIKRMEDVKKLLYAGCYQAILDYRIPSNVEITEEVSLKFGKEKILCLTDSLQSVSDYIEMIQMYCTELIVTDLSNADEEVSTLTIPILRLLPEISLDKLFAVLSNEQVSGVTGGIVTENINTLSSIKSLCKERGIPVKQYVAAIPWADLKIAENGLIPVVTQDYKTNEVLMVAYMNEEAYNATVRSGKMTYFSRSRNELWLKGETSGHYQFVKALYADCDKDTILAKVSQIGVACHTGAYSCFFNEILKKPYNEKNPLLVFEDVFSVIKDRKVNPKEGSYTNYLFDKGTDKILKKLGEEATEIVIAAKNPNPSEIKYEISDFLYHMMVLMADKDITWEEISTELATR